MLKQKIHGTKGFNLIEMLTVIVILGILLSISVPSFFVHIRRTRAAEAIATMELIRQAQREYFARHNAYLAVASPYLKNEPTDANPGLGIDVKTVHYFSNSAFSVAVPGASSHFTTVPTTPIDFVISALGSASNPCGASDCAARQADVATYELEMDNTGRAFICYGGCGTAANWSAW